MNVREPRKEVKEMPTEEYAPSEQHELLKADLSLNVNPYGISRKVLNRLKSIDPSVIYNYYPLNRTLIDSIAKYVGVKRENILLGDGCDGCIHLFAITFIANGDKVLIPTPTFHRYEFHAKMMGGVVEFLPMENFQFSADEVLKKEGDFKAIFLCNPSNPTGMEIDDNEIIKLLDNFSGYVVVDEALADISNINTSKYLEKYDNLIVLRSFSKSFGLASMRIGYMVAHPNVLNQVAKLSSPFKVNGIAQELAIEALKDENHLKESVAFLNVERDYLIEGLTSLGFPCTQSVNTNILFDCSKVSKSSAEFVKLLRSESIAVTDASVFKVQRDTYIRISVSTHENNQYFIETLSKMVKQSV